MKTLLAILCILTLFSLAEARDTRAKVEQLQRHVTDYSFCDE